MTVSQQAQVIDLAGQTLSPCHPAQARKLIRTGLAEVLTKRPFTIRMLSEDVGQQAESIQDQRTPSREWLDAIQQVAHAREPKNGLAERYPSTNIVSGRLPTADDIRIAAMYRLRKWTREQIDQGIETVAEMLPNVDETLLDLPDRNDAWTAACALTVMYAESIGDLATFWVVGHEVLAAYRQAQRAKLKAGAGDSLSSRIAVYLAEGITRPAEIWGDLRRIAEEGGDDVVDEYDDGCLFFQARAGDEDTTSITFEAFRRRVQRMQS